MTAEASQVQIGVLQVQVKHLETQVGELKTDIANQAADFKTQMSAQNVKLDAVLEKLSEARGGWKTLMLLGGAAAGFGATVTAVINHVKFN